MSFVCLFAAVALACVPQEVPASAFLERMPADEPDVFQDVAILDQLEEAIGKATRWAIQRRVWSVTKSLSSIFSALPKNEHGAVSAAAARYAIHRVFLQRHGWQMKGVASSGQMWSSSSPVSAIGDRLSESAHDVFEDRLGARGFDRHDLAVLAATLENLIHSEVVGRLEATYKTLGKSLDGKLDKNSVLGIVDTYMAVYLSDRNISDMSRQEASEMVNTIGRRFPGWDKVQEFVRTTQRKVAGKLLTLAFRDVLRIMEAISEGFGRSMTSECDNMRDRLLGLEDGNGTGRIRLSEFHASAVQKGYSQFRETADYLRHVGAIDDSDPLEPRVIIPNYLHNPMNCLASSKYYAVCCPDPCESMMEQLEGKIQAPHASPEVIVDIVSEYLSVSTPSHRNLSAALISKLNDVAKQSGGLVPLHGRLFAQWMHFANPRECPYPHISNTTSYSSGEEFRRMTGNAHAHTKVELTRIASSHASLKKEAVESRGPGDANIGATTTATSFGTNADSAEADDSMCLSMWEPVEELVDPVHGAANPDEPQQALSIDVCLRVLAMVGAVVSLCAVLKDFAMTALTVGTNVKAQAKAGWSSGLP